MVNLRCPLFEDIMWEEQFSAYKRIEGQLLLQCRGEVGFREIAQKENGVKILP